jgi:hypothetical protein
MYNGNPLPKNEIALLLNPDSRVWVSVIDEKPLDFSSWVGYPREIELLPGTHQAYLYIRHYVFGGFWSKSSKISFNALAGHVYQIELTAGSNDWDPEIRDITDKYLAK